MTANARERVAEAIEQMPLVDHHVHGMLADPLAEADLLDAMVQASHVEDRAAVFDSQFGFAVRRWCAPALGLEPFADAAEYLAARSELGFDEATSRLLRASGITTYLIDGGHAPERLVPDERMMRLADARSHPIVRLETLAEGAMSGASSGADFLDRLEGALTAASERAVGYKTVAAYRTGLALEPARPTAAEVGGAADAWFAAGDPRLTDATVIRHLAWWALEQGSVLQVHVGFGDGDLRLDRADPFLLQPFLAATQHAGGRVVLLHCYPFVREAGMLAHLYPHVHLDAGLALGQVGANADVVLRETLDLTPFSKLLFSTDAWGAPERVLVGAAAWRNAATDVLADYVDRHGWPADEAIRIAELMAWRNAEALYGRHFVTP
ncbi:amidohydrolase [Agromyces sp. NPDC056523]|uniref:amidohydrolase n=1 Tax=Agromyces sp. NPDC056523 TaxID=3345850 RepID=UPI00366B02C9